MYACECLMPYLYGAEVNLKVWHHIKSERKYYSANPPSFYFSVSSFVCPLFVPQFDTWGVGLHGTTAVDKFLAKQNTQEQWQAQVRAAKAFVSPPSPRAGRKMSLARVMHRFKSFRTIKAGIATVNETL